MAQDKPSQAGQKGQQNAKKRKEPPTSASRPNNDSHKRPKTDHRAKQRDARQLSAQTSSKAFKNGELDVDKFVRAREFEIRALEEGMSRSKTALTKRAFQQVPKELRRRTASHNVKKVPKRLKERGKREMNEDNTPTVTARRRKSTPHMRLRQETVKKLRALGSKRKAEKEKAKAETITVTDLKASAEAKPADTKQAPATTAIKTRVPKIKKATLAKPPVPKAKFRKRQIHKSWLPTHLFHAKRARMAPPSAPVWRFSVPLTPTVKSYRPTHRASHERGAVAWDMSYISTIGLEGRQDSIVGMLKALGVINEDLSGKKGEKWRHGTRVLEASVYEREAPHQPIAPVTVMWCVEAKDEKKSLAPEKKKRKVMLRSHPSAFYELWEEILRLSKIAKPEVSVEDLRFEIGSIEITGPGATEALLGALWPTPSPADPAEGTASGGDAQTAGAVAPEEDKADSGRSVGETWTSLAGLTNPALLPQNAMLAFDVQDPRLHFPPRTIKLPATDPEQTKVLELIADWPVEAAQGPPELFDRGARLAASRALPSQKAVNRRKGLAPLGQYPEPSKKDPKIPALLYTTSSNPSPTDKRRQTQNASWTLLLPWKCVQPVWYSLMYYPLSTGQQPRFGGLDEKRQLAFEAGQPWFPADFPGRKAGWEWEVSERVKREDEWKRRPKAKRISWEKVELGGGRVGEVGVGWSCDWERLLAGPPEVGVGGGEAVAGVAGTAGGEQTETSRTDRAAGKDATLLPREATVPDAFATKEAAKAIAGDDSAPPKNEPRSQDATPSKDAAGPQMPPPLHQLSAAQATAVLKNADSVLPPHIAPGTALMTVRLTLITRGVPQTCARIYRLPSAGSNVELRKQWLALIPANQPNAKHKGPKNALPRLPKDAPAHLLQRRLAQTLLEPPRAGEDDYPACPGEEDLIGFVTTGNFNLGEGQGTGLGSILLARVLEQARGGGDKEGRAPSQAKATSVEAPQDHAQLSAGHSSSTGMDHGPISDALEGSAGIHDKHTTQSRPADVEAPSVLDDACADSHATTQGTTTGPSTAQSDGKDAGSTADRTYESSSPPGSLPENDDRVRSLHGAAPKPNPGTEHGIKAQSTIKVSLVKPQQPRSQAPYGYWRLSPHAHQEQENRQPTPPVDPGEGFRSEEKVETLAQLQRRLFDAGKNEVFATLTRSHDPTKPKTAVLNIATLQHMALQQFQYEIARYVSVMYHSGQFHTEMEGYKPLNDLLSKYCDAVRNLDYMKKCALGGHEKDAFLMKSSRSLERKIMVTVGLVPHHVLPAGPLPLPRDAHCPKLRDMGRNEANRAAYEKQRLLRFAMAGFGGLLLIVPMLTMAEVPGKIASLTTTCVAILVFAALISWFTNLGPNEVLATTAAYAAVLVVFVGTSLAPASVTNS
ncbi:hypothetical protein LTR85_009892 [Meristemomyces frigidus]|nr:hypothetical protein LTR85_009892 [Meristemomyces frigidus]